MNLQEIEKILERYYDGETSLDEEKRLRKFFASGEVPPKWKGLQEYYSLIAAEKQIKMENQSFDSRLEAAISDSRMSRIFDLRCPWIYWAAGVAASLLILVAIFVKFDPFSGKIHDTYNNPEVAYAQAKKILMFVSAKMNRGTKDLQQIEKFDQALRDVQPVASFSKGLDGVNRVGDLDKVKKMISSN